MQAKRGFLITIEGIEGAGKSTVMQYVCDYLARLNINVLATREPGGTKIAEEIRGVLLHPKADESMMPKTELLLMFAARAQHVGHVILPALNEGKWVVSDRFVDASFAYQGGGRYMNMADIQALADLTVRDCYPALTLLLDLPVQEALRRTETRGTQKDRIEQEALTFFERVRESYLQRAKAEPNRMKIIHANHPLQDVTQQIETELAAFIKKAST